MLNTHYGTMDQGDPLAFTFMFIIYYLKAIIISGYLISEIGVKVSKR